MPVSSIPLLPHKTFSDNNQLNDNNKQYGPTFINRSPQSSVHILINKLKISQQTFFSTSRVTTTDRSRTDAMRWEFEEEWGRTFIRLGKTSGATFLITTWPNSRCRCRRRHPGEVSPPDRPSILFRAAVSWKIPE